MISVSESEVASLLEGLRRKNQQLERKLGEPLAIVGVGCRLPGGINSATALWAALEEGKTFVGAAPEERMRLWSSIVPGWEAQADSSIRYGGFLSEPNLFDAAFFGMTPREALATDPQQRIALEVAFEAVVNSGIPISRMQSAMTSVHLGVSASDYIDYSGDEITPYSATGNAHSIVANRISYALDFKGESVAIDTACSSSLVALKMGSLALQQGASDYALVGGVNILGSPRTAIAMSRLGTLSSDGACRAFDKEANGTVRGEGCVILILRRLSDALRDGSTVLALIRGVAVNQDGRSSALVAPNGLAQERVIRAALKQSGFKREHVQYVEAHGTGTLLGDAIEMEALGATYGDRAETTAECVVGSVKTNFGHLESAAGALSVLKMALSIRNRRLPGTAHFRNYSAPSEARRGLKVQSKSTGWAAEDQLLVGGVSSFGFGGTNAHAILSELDPYFEDARLRDAKAAALAGGPRVVLATARTPEQAFERMKACASSRGNFHDVAMTTVFSQSPMAARLAVTAHSRREFATKVDGVKNHAASQSNSGRVAFVFSGQGSQYIGMALNLVKEMPELRQELDACDDAFRKEAGWSPSEVLRGGPEAAFSDISRLQALIFCAQAVLARAWILSGVTPRVIVGHSMGEVAAAYVAGALSLADAAKIVTVRSRLLSRLQTDAAMAVVNVSASAAAKLVHNRRLAVAAVNAPASCVIAGETSSLDQLLHEVEAMGVYCQKVRGAVGAHTFLVEPLRDELLASLASIQPRTPRFPFLSSVEGTVGEPARCDAEYWWRNVRQPVAFAEVISNVAPTVSALLEVSAHPVMANALRECVGSLTAAPQVLSTLRRGQPDLDTFVDAAARLLSAGVDVDLSTVLGRTYRVDVSAQTYPWDHASYWQVPASRAGAAAGLFSQYVEVAKGEYVFQGELSFERYPFLKEHVVRGDVVLPGTGYIPFFLDAARRIRKGSALIEDLRFEDTLSIPPEGVDLKLHVNVAEDGLGHVEVLARTKGADTEWTPTAKGVLRWEDRSGLEIGWDAASADRCLQKGESVNDVAAHYREIADTAAVEFGASFQGVIGARVLDAMCVAQVQLPANVSDDRKISPHPAALDIFLQAATFPLARLGVRGLPVSFGRCVVPEDVAQVRRTFAVLTQTSDTAWVAEVVALDELNRAVGIFSGVQIRAQAARAADRPNLFATSIVEKPASTAPVDCDATLVVGYEDEPTRDVISALVRAGRTVKTVIVSAQDAAQSDAELRAAVQGLAAFKSFDVVWLPAISPTIQERNSAILAGAVLPMAVVQAIHEVGAAHKARVVVVTKCLAGRELPSSIPWSAVARGFFLSASLEHTDLRIRLVDVETTETLAPKVLAELNDGGVESRVVYTEGRRWVERIESISSAAAAEPAFKGQVVLISGGAGGLGQVLARWLVDQGAAGVILVGRRRRQEFSGDIFSDSRVVYESADLSVLEATRSAIESGERALGGKRVSSVIHGAMVLDDGVITAMSAERYLGPVTRAKVDAALILHEALSGRQLSHVVFMSSAAAFLGSPGQSNYAAANAFQDAFARYLTKLKTVDYVHSIQWGPWSEAGVAARLGHVARMGAGALTNAAAFDGLERVLTSSEVVTAVIPSGLVRKLVAAAADNPFLAPLDRAAKSSEVEDKLSSPLEWLASTGAKVLGRSLAEVRTDVALTDAGFDSLMTLELRNAIARRYSLRLTVKDFAGAPTLADLAEKITRHIGGATAEPAAVAVATGAPPPQKDSLLSLVEEIATLPPGLVLPQAARAKFSSLFLTGATGLVGGHFLRSLMRETGVQVHCLVRADSADGATKRVEDLTRKLGIADLARGRVFAVRGDASQPQFGMDPKDYARLSQETDSVVHSAATVNWYHSLERLRAANVDATKEAAIFAMTGVRKRLVYVSSIATFFGWLGMRAGRTFERSFPNGYMQSKWASELIVRNFVARGGDGCMLRVAQVGGTPEDGSVSDDDFFTMLVRGCLRFGVPKDFHYVIQVIRADILAAAMTKIVAAPGRLPSVLHLVPEEAMSWEQFWATMSSLGIHYDRLSREAWEKRLQSSPDDWRLEQTIRVFGDFEFPPFFVPTATKLTLRDLQATLAPLDAETIRSYLRFWLPASSEPHGASS